MLLGTHETGTAVTARVTDPPGLLASVTGTVFARGGNVRAIASHAPGATCADAGPSRPGRAGEAAIFVKVTGVLPDELVAAIQPLVERIEEVRNAATSSSVLPRRW